MTNRALRAWVLGTVALGVVFCVLYVSMSGDAREAARDLIPLIVAILAAVLAFQFQRRLMHIRRLDEWSVRMNSVVESLQGLLETAARPGDTKSEVSTQAPLLWARGEGVLALGQGVVPSQVLDSAVIRESQAALLAAAHYETGDLDPSPVAFFVAEWPSILRRLWI